MPYRALAGAGVELTRLEHPVQAIVVQVDGTVTIAFLGVVFGDRITGTDHETHWAAYVQSTSEPQNPLATSLARSLGWSGVGAFHGIVFFTGDGGPADVPGRLIAHLAALTDDVDFGG